MTANYTFPENISRVGEFLRWENSVTNNWMGNVLVLVVFVVFFIAMKNYPTKSALAMSSFISMIISVFLYTLGMVHPLIVLATILITAICGLSLILGKG
jgi:hypothetical protein